LKLKAEKNVDHVITHSSGNHGQALAFAAQKAGIKCTVVVPDNAPKVKVDAIRAYGADIVVCESTMAARNNTCNRIIAETGAVLVHPHDDLNVMAGQGTIAMELFEQVPNLDAVLVPVGGGGMISGIAAWTKHVNPKCKVFAVEPFGKQLSRSLKAGHLICEDRSKLLNTLADGMRIPGIGDHCFPVLSSLCEKEVFSVTDDQIIDAMKLSFQRLKLVIEPSSATGVGALFSNEFKAHLPSLKHVAVIVCGGNVDLDTLPWNVK
jgi:threonine dehydratase